jgi:hypothetical protein
VLLLLLLPVTVLGWMCACCASSLALSALLSLLHHSHTGGLAAQVAAEPHKDAALSAASALVGFYCILILFRFWS